MKTKAFLAFLFLAACTKSVVDKPDNLIDENKMVDVIYDLSLLEAIKSQRPIDLETHHINAQTYVFKKYKIDSIQFVKSNKYYASDLKNYKEMYDKVAKKIEKNKAKVDSLITKNGGKLPVFNPDLPRVE